MKRFRFLILIVICSIGILCSTLSAMKPDTLRVPSQYPTIQAGIDAAATGDIVLVAPGVYTDSGNKNLDFGGKAILVTSESGADSTIIDCEVSGRAFYFHSGEDSLSIVRGFTIRNGFDTTGGGGAIRCDSQSSPTIASNSFAENRAPHGGAIYCDSSSPLVVNSTFTANRAIGRWPARGSGGAIYCDSFASPIVRNCILWGNLAFNAPEIFGPTALVTYSDVKGGWPGTGNINADPEFNGPPNDVRLRWDSPCVDSGDPASPSDPDSTRADMGAYYFDQRTLIVTIELQRLTTEAYPGDTLRCEAAFTNRTDQQQTFQYWARAQAPDSSWLEILSPVGYNLGPNVRLVDTIEQQVAPEAVLGIWKYQGRVGPDTTQTWLDDTFSYPVATPVLVDIACLTATVRRGDSLRYERTLSNRSGVSQPFWYWARQKGPDSTWSQAIPPVEYNLVPGDTLTDTLKQQVSPNAIPGTWEHHGYVGPETTQAWLEDSFTFRVTMSSHVVRVPVDCPTIQLGIDAALAGDTVLVASGTYVGPGNRDLDYHGKAIVVTSESGADSTVIDCGSAGRAFIFQSGEGPGSVVQGFTLTNGQSSAAGAIGCLNSNPVIVDNIITSNAADKGSAIVCNNSSPLITGNTIAANYASGGYEAGGAIFCLNSSSPTVAGNTFTANYTSGYLNAGGAIYCKNSSPVIDSNSFTSNYASGTLSGGGAIYCLNSDAVITGNSFIRNAGQYYGGAIYCDGSNLFIARNVFIRDTTRRYGGYGGAICCHACSSTVENNTFTANRADYGGAIAVLGGSILTIRNCILYGDTGMGGRELYAESSSVTVTYSDVQGGWPGTGNVNADPLFVSPPWDVHLQWGSPCIDAGDPASLPDPDSTRADMGAFYYDQRPGIENTEAPFTIQQTFSLKSLPNPFAKSTTIFYSIPSKSYVNLAVFNLVGQLVETLVNQEQEPGQQSIRWQGARELSLGVYFMRLRSGNRVVINKILLTK